MGSLIEELGRREASARAEAIRLRSRMEDLARAQEQASRLAITREEVTRVLEGPAAAELPAGQNGRPAGEARPGSPIGAVTVPPWQEGAEASVLPRAYQDLLEVAADAERPLRAGEFPAAAGLATGKAALVVLSADCIVVRPGALRAATAKAAERLGKMRTRLSAGEKPNRKRMAALVTVYDTEPAKRRPHDVIAPPGGRNGTRPLRPGPKALAKWLAGSVRKDPAEVIAAAFDEAEARDPGHLRTWVVLVDGADHQLSLIRAEAARRGVTIHVIIDIIHLLEYLWGAAWSFHEAGDPAAEDWVAVKALAVLAGDSVRGRGGDHRPGRLRPPGRQPARRGRRVRPLPGEQARLPAL